MNFESLFRQKQLIREKFTPSPVDCDGHHVHEGGRHIAIEEEREDSAERRSQGPGLVNIPRYRSVTISIEKRLGLVGVKYCNLSIFSLIESIIFLIL